MSPVLGIKSIIHLAILVAFVTQACAISSRFAAIGAESNSTKPNWTTIQDLNPNAPSANQPIKRKWAVVIGLDKFSEHRLNSERKQDDAALEFVNYLTDEHGGRFARSHIRLLTNNEATLQNISNTCGKQWLGRLAGPEDLVVIFISTDSFPTTDGGTYLCTYNTSLDNVVGSCLSIRDLMENLRKNVNCNRIVLVLQSGYSGTAELTSGAKSLVSPCNADIDKVLTGKGFVILSSSKPDQLSWSNVFSTNLISALREEDGLVHLRDAFNKAKQATEKQTAQVSGMALQSPVMKWDWKGTDLVLGAPAIEDNAELPESVRTYLSSESHYLAANNLVEAGQTEAAIEEYKKALIGEPDYSDVMADYGSVLAMKGDFKAAAEQYQQAIAIKPNDALYHANYARILAKMGTAEESIKELETSYKLNPHDVSVITVLAERYSKAGKADIGENLLRKALETLPRSAKLHDRLGFALSRQGKIDGAIEEAKKCVAIDPDYVMGRLNYGSLLLASGKPQDAIIQYKSAIAAGPTSPDAHYLLADALAEAGEKKAAISELQEFLRLAAPADLRIAKAKERLSALSH